MKIMKKESNQSNEMRKMFIVRITGNYKTIKACNIIISDPYNLGKSFTAIIVQIF
jgi:hypothetical protein